MSEVLSAVSILIVFFTIFLDLLSRRVDNLIQQKKPSSAEYVAQKTLIRNYRKTIYGMAIPLSLGLCVILYVFLPTTVNIIKTAHFMLWDFNPLEVLYVVINTGVLVLMILSVILLVRLIQRLREVQRP
jgi:hypothetical protein